MLVATLPEADCMAVRAVVCGYLEDISVKAFDHHPDDLNEVIGHEGGIYCLYKQDRLYYVGLAKNLYGRIKQHRKDKHRGKWNRFSAYITKRTQHIRELESLMLRVTAPRGNRQRGKLSGASDLKRELMQCMKQSRRLHEAEMLGGGVAKQKRKRAAKGARGSKALSALAGRRRRLWAKYKGKDYSAILTTKGQVRFDGTLYDSPSAAAKAVVGRHCNGWTFWYYPIGRREWAPLLNLR
jgi:predicted GIY-YIG superfamily endonuclease